jgi:hypothetical protein
MLRLRDAPPTAELRCTAIVQRQAYLLRRYLSFFRSNRVV